MDVELIKKLLYEEEGSTLDFKRAQYPFEGASDIEKSELLKDILAFANAWRRTDAFILIGVEEVKGGRSVPVGIASHFDDAKLQQFVNSKINRPMAFAYETVSFEGVQIGVIRVEVQERPFYLLKDYGKLKGNWVYIKRSSSTDVANPDEVARMGITLAREVKPLLDENIKVSLRAYVAATSLPPFGTGEPIHLEVAFTITNVGHMPVFVVAAALKDKTRSRSLGFSHLCSESEPLQPGGRRNGVLKLLYHEPYPHNPRAARTKEALAHDNRFTYRLLRFICQEGSVCEIETGRGTTLTYPANEVCDASFLGWPILATPDDLLAELQSKSLDEFIQEERAACERPAGKGPGGEERPVADESRR